MIITRICFPYFPMEASEFREMKASITFFLIHHPKENFFAENTFHMDKERKVILGEPKKEKKSPWEYFHHCLEREINYDFPLMKKIEIYEPDAKMIVLHKDSPYDSHFGGSAVYAGIHVPSRDAK